MRLNTALVNTYPRLRTFSYESNDARLHMIYDVHTYVRCSDTRLPVLCSTVVKLIYVFPDIVCEVCHLFYVSTCMYVNWVKNRYNTPTYDAVIDTTTGTVFYCSTVKLIYVFPDTSTVCACCHLFYVCTCEYVTWVKNRYNPLTPQKEILFFQDSSLLES